uniref:FH2 domain containing 3 n=1 Tax=Oryzias melastigma TaxID=30732 RepID=A0A3B3DIS0_ORYME
LLSPFTGHLLKRSMKKLNWDTIPSQHVVGKLNVWTSKRPQRDLVLDIRTMEELFCHTDKQASLRSSRHATLRRGNRIDLSPGPQVTAPHKVKILDSKKSMNVGIFLRHFKSGKLRLLPEADQFMVQLVKVPSYEQRLKTMMVREEFFPFMEEVKDSVSVMTKAAQELLDCDDLHSVIRLVLKAGNYMNAGSYSANAIGFRMSSLLKLADTKANKPGMNLMHYVAKVTMTSIFFLYIFFPKSWVCNFLEEAADENREREAKEQRHKRKESIRFIAKRRSTGSCRDAETIGDSVCLESALHNLLSTVPSSFSRCRRNGPLPADVLLSEGGSPPAERAVSTPRNSRVSPEEKHAKLQRTDELTAKQNKKDTEDVHEISRTVLHFQKRRSILDGYLVSGSCHSEKRPDKPSTPATPRPKTRDYFFVTDGDVGSPWTILSPVSCSRRMQHRQNTVPSTPSRDDLDDGVWETDNSRQPRPHQDASPSPANGFKSFPDFQRASSHRPLSRSASSDEAQQSYASSFRLGDLFQRSTTQRTYSSISRAANKREDGSGVEGSSGFISFFKRIGGRNKPAATLVTVGKDSA